MKNTIIAIVTLVVVLALCLFSYELIFKKPLVESPSSEEQVDLTGNTLNVKEQYQNGSFTIAGDVEVPTPCHTVSANVAPSNSNTYMINIITTPPKDGVACAQMVTTRQFKVTFAAPQNAELKANINGAEYMLNRFEIPAGEDIDDYQLELKG